jgi:amino acid transporter
MIFSILLLIVFIFLAFRISPRERDEDKHIHGAGQIGLLAAVALFGVDYFTSFYYATGEMMSALHPYGLQQYSYIAVAVIAFANIAFGGLYMYSLGIFNEGGGSYTASMRYLKPSLSLIVAVTLLQDYILTIVVSSLSGVDQLLSVLNAYDANWVIHFLIGAVLVAITWYLTIRGRGESARIVFILLGVFILMTVTLGFGLILANMKGVAAVVSSIPVQNATLGQAMFHMLTASMKGMVALTGLEAMSNGIQFVKNEDAKLVLWGKKHLPRLHGFWQFYSGKAGIGRFVQTSFLFYGGITTLFLTYFSLRFNVFDGTLGRTLVGNLAFIGFEQIPGGIILFWVYQFLAVGLLAAASMTAFQDLQSTGWRDVAIGELPEIIVYRNDQGTFTRSVTVGFIATLIIQLLVRGQTSVAVPFYGVGVFMPIAMMGLAVRRHLQTHASGRKRTLGMMSSTLVSILAAAVFIGQIAGKWQEGGWVVLISFSVLIIGAHLLLIAPSGYRDQGQIKRIVYDKAKVRGSMATIVEWQSLRMQEFRYSLIQRIAIQTTRFFGLFGIHRPLRFEPLPFAAGEYDEAVHIDLPLEPLSPIIPGESTKIPQVGGRPNQTSENNL